MSTPTMLEILAASIVGEGAFWQAVAEALPTITTGDLDPGAAHRLTLAMRAAVITWAADNTPDERH